MREQSAQPGTSRFWWGLLPLFLALSLLFLIYPYQVDDASITYRYASHAAQGLGPVFNPGGPVSEGFTSPLWFLLLTLGALIFGPQSLPNLAFVMGSLSYLAMLGLFWARGRREPLLLWFPGLLLAATWPSLIFYSATGLEMALFLLALLLALSLPHARGLPRKAGWAATFLLPWIRPEALWLLPVLTGITCLDSLGERLRSNLSLRQWLLLLARRLRQETLKPILVLLAGQGLLWILRLLVFGTLFPNTFYAKSPSWGDGLLYLLSFLGQPLTWGLLLLALIGGLSSPVRRRHFLWAGLLWLPAPVLEGGDWMPHFRFFLPATLCLLAAVGEDLSGKRHAKSGFRLPLGVAGSILFLALLLGVARDLKNTGMRAQETFDLLTKRERDIALWVVSRGIHSVGTVDLGVLGFTSRVELVDLAGLTDPRIARAPGGHLRKTFPLDYLFDERRPEVLILRSSRPPRLEQGQLKGCRPASEVEEQILTDPRLTRDYTWGFSLEIEGMPKQAKLFFLRKDRAFPAGTIPESHQIILRRFVSAPPAPTLPGPDA